jgi:MoaA/NifB/PqqE/SkfB family radical SAM enzyme
MDGFKKILGRLPYLTSLSFAGQGEPLLNPEMFDLLEYSARRVLRIYLISNALTLNDSSARRLLKIPGLNILFSLKGKDAAEFAEITCLPERLFDQQMENIRRIAELRNTTRANLYLRAGYVLTKRNYRYMNEVISLVEGLGVDRLQFDNLVPLHNMEEGTGSLYEDDVEVREYIEELKKIPRKVRIDYPTLIRNHSHTYYCRGFVEMPGIDAHGNLTGCMRVRTPQPEQGNIFRDADFMNNPHFLEARQGFLNKQIPTQCKTCVEMSGIDLL